MAVEDARLEFPLRPSDDAAPGTLLSSPVAFFSVLPRLRLTNVVFDFVDAADNWRFKLDVAQVQSRLRDGVEYLDASAKLNGSPLTLSFQFDRDPNPPSPGKPPYGAALSVQGRGLTAHLRTRSWRAAFDDNLTLALTASSSSLGDCWRWQASPAPWTGGAGLAASLMTDPHTISARGIALDLDFTSGIRSSITGSIADVMDGRGIDLMTVTDVAPSSKPATSLLDITVTRLSGVSMTAAGPDAERGGAGHQRLFPEPEDIGPISVASIRRDEGGRWR